MKYEIRFSPSAKKKFDKLDRYTQLLIAKWMMKHIESVKDPTVFAKPLTANRVGQWRYRIGDYRLIALIEDDKLIVLVIDIGHRREIYKD